jgi:hypothetical protein
MHINEYLENFVEPTIRDFEENPKSKRHAFLACVATFHCVDYFEPKNPKVYRNKFRRASTAFATIDRVAHAFKHQSVGRIEIPASEPLKAEDICVRPPAIWGEAVWGLSRWDDAVGGVTIKKNHEVDLLKEIKEALSFIRSKLLP